MFFMICQEISTGVYMTLGATELRIPSLSECADDIPQIAQRMIREIATSEGKDKIPALDDGARDYLRTREWEHSFDELEVLLQSVVLRTQKSSISAKMLTSDGSDGGGCVDVGVSPLRQHLISQRDEYIQAVLVMSNGNYEKASSALGIDIKAIKKLLTAR